MSVDNIQLVDTMICFFVDTGNTITISVSHYMLFLGTAFDFFFNLSRSILGVSVASCLNSFKKSGTQIKPKIK